MILYLKRYYVFGIMIFFTCNVVGQAYYDCTKFDIAGVQLGMDAEVAVRKMIENIEAYPSVSLSGTYPVSKNVYRFLTEDGVKINMIALPSIPFSHAELMEIVWIKYEQENTKRNEMGMAKIAVDKYGEPSLIDVGSRNLHIWCGESEYENLRRYRTGDPILTLWLSQLTLEHQNYESKILKEYYEEFTKQKSGF